MDLLIVFDAALAEARKCYGDQAQTNLRGSLPNDGSSCKRLNKIRHQVETDNQIEPHRAASYWTTERIDQAAELFEGKILNDHP